MEETGREPQLGSRAAGFPSLGHMARDPGPRAENTSWRGRGWVLPGNQILPQLGPSLLCKEAAP